MAQSTVNLVKNIAGAGMLSLPSGVAAFSGSPKAVFPTFCLVLAAGFISAYGFILIADACNRTGETTYAKVWAKSISKGTSWLPAMACLAKAAIGCISFSMILGDCLSLMLSPLGLPALVASRSSVIMALTATVLMPLCNMKSLAPLAKFSVLGVLSNVFICGFIILRCLDGSYGPAGRFAAVAPAAPVFVAHAGSTWSTLMNPGVTVVLSILSTAYLAHYNAPMFYEQLAPDPEGGKDRRFVIVSVLGFAIAGLIFSVVMAGGFLTFGVASKGLILNSYAVTDGWATFARGAIVCSLITAYPLVFLSLRKQLVDVLGDRGANFAAEKPRLLTLLMLIGITALALRLTNLGRLVGFAGACFGTFLIYVAPALMVLGAQRRGLGPQPKGFAGGLARVGQILLVPLGMSLGVLGAIQSLK